MKKIMLPISVVIMGVCVIISFLWTMKPEYNFTMQHESAYPVDIEDIHYTIQMEDGTQQWTISGENDQLSYQTKFLNSFKQPSANLLEDNAFQGYLNYQPILPENVTLDDLEIVETKEEIYRNSDRKETRTSVNDYYEMEQLDLAMFVETKEGYAAFPVPMQVIQSKNQPISFLYNGNDQELYFNYSFYSNGKTNARRWKHTSVQLHDQTYVASYATRVGMEGKEAIYRIHSDYKSDHEVLPTLSEVMKETKVEAIYTLPGTYLLQDMIAYGDYLFVIMSDEDMQKLVKLDDQGNVVEEIILGDKQQSVIYMEHINQALCITLRYLDKYTFYVYEGNNMRVLATHEGSMEGLHYNYHDGSLYVLYQDEEAEKSGLSVMLSIFKDDQTVFSSQLQGDYLDEQKVAEFNDQQNSINSSDFPMHFKRVITNYAFDEEDQW